MSTFRIATHGAGAMALWLCLSALPYACLRAQDINSNAIFKTQNIHNCFDQNLPSQRRLESCTQLIKRENLSSNELAKVYLSRAQVFKSDGDTAAAALDTDAAVRADPTYEKAWLIRANERAAQGDVQLALDDYNAALKLAPKDPLIYDNRGNALMALARNEEAIADFTRAITFDSHDTLAYSNRATAALRIQDYASAIEGFSFVIQERPDDGMAFYNRATAYEHSGAFDKALQDYRRAARLQPQYAPALAAVGRLMKSKDPEEAAAQFSEAIRADPHSPARRSRASLYLSMARYEEALRDFNTVIADNPSDNIAYLDRGVTQQKMGHLDLAIIDFTRSIALAPSAAAFANRGNAYLEQAQLQKAIADFDSALQLDAVNVPALLGRANANYTRKDVAASLDDYAHVLAADPKNVTAYFKRGNLHFDERDFASSFEDYSQALALDPDQPVTLYNRSLAATRIGRRKEAEDDRRRALALDPQLAVDERRARRQ